jgi:beta-N-acetylglucosaminidase
MQLFGIKNTRWMIAFGLILTLLLSSGGFQPFITYAYEKQTGMIVTDASMVETKDQPSDFGARVSGLVYGKPVTVIDEVTGDDGLKWYQITYKLKADHSVTKTAYVHAYNVILDKDATVVASATINANEIGIRDDAGTDGTIVVKTLNQGNKVEILDQTSVGSALWYRVRYTTEGDALIGWVLSNYVTIDEYVYEPDLDFEDQMRKIGFPESYIDSLSYLHSKYPNWKFVPVMIGIDWDEVIENESVPNRNLIGSYRDDSLKSLASTEYNWKTNIWTPRDTGGWVTAHPDYIAYCMDPRNFLTETNIFMFEGLSYSDGYTMEGINAILKGTFMVNDRLDTDGTTFSYADVFMNAGKTYGVSPYHLASRVRQEQGVYGTSVMISGTYAGFEGFYNYFNIGASGGDKTTVIINGLTEAKTAGWTSHYLALMGGSQKVAKNYISIGQDTLYFQKFNVVYKPGLYWKQYMQNVEAAISEGKTIGKGYYEYISAEDAFIFRIPVYDNMPEKAVTFTETGNPNNYLSDLSISGLQLTPTFDGDVTSYSVIVENAVSSINIKATAVASTSTISGTGTYTLQEGDNTIAIHCKSQSGNTRTYTVNVYRKAPDTNEEEGYQWNTDKYKVDTYITGVSPETSAEDFLSAFTTQGCELKLLTATGEENTGFVATGNKLAVYVDGSLVSNQEIVIYGDVNCDGKITMSDLLSVNRHIIGTIKLSEAKLEAGDVNRKGDGATMSDLLAINRHLIGTIFIEQ